VDVGFESLDLRMLPLTIFLGKLIGLYCIVVALAMMAHKQSAVAAVNALINEPATLAVRRSARPRRWPRYGARPQ